MKRFCAAVIDVILAEGIGTILFCVILSIWRVCRNHTMQYMGSYSGLGLLGAQLLSLFLANILYFFLFQWKKNGRTVGKWLLRIPQPGSESMPVGKCLLRALFKTIACFLYPVTIGYYLYFDRMPYERLDRSVQIQK